MLTRIGLSDWGFAISSDPSKASSGAAEVPEALQVLKKLTDTPWVFDAFDLMRRMDATHDGPGFGRSHSPSQDVARLGQRASMSFQPSSVNTLSPHPVAPLIRMSFSGLFGSNGAMPLHLTEWIHDRRHREDDTTLEAFADIFHHRFFSLLYRAWADSNPIVSLDSDPEDDVFRRFVGALGGIFGLDFQTKDDHGRRYYMSHIGAGAARPESIEKVLEDRFRVPAQIKEFVSQWLDLDEADRVSLGSYRLGEGKILGNEVYSRSTRFELELGPLSREDFEAFLPGGRNIDGLRELLTAIVGLSMSWQVRLVLKPEAVIGVKLSQTLGNDGSRLGFDSWMIDKVSPTEPRRDLVINDVDYEFDARPALSALA